MFLLKNIKVLEVLTVEELKINESEITCIVGESGGGKTTLLKLLNNLISPTSGQISYQGEPLDKINPIELRKNVVLLPQEPFIFNKTVRDNLVKGLNYHKLTYDNALLEKTLKIVQFNKPLDSDIAYLSGGEKQRLALARLLVLNPKVLLLDEPSSALDEATEEAVIEQVVKYVKDNNKSLVMVTHSKTIAKKYADIIYTISHGKIEHGEAYGT